MKKFMAILMIVGASALAYSAAIPFRWEVETSRPTKQTLQVFRGETVNLMPRIKNNGAAMDLSSQSVSLYYQTNGMGNAWFVVQGTPGLSGEVSVPFSPENDVGASEYSFYVECKSADAGPRMYRAYGTLQMLNSPGFNPSTVPATAYASLLSTLSDILIANNTFVRAETDPVWSADKPNYATKEYVDGKVPAESDPVAGPRLTLIEDQTNNWRQAWTWGNHAAAGYLAATAWQSWLSTNTYVRAELDQTALAALADFAQTNRVTRWQDSADTNIWWSAVGGTSLVATVWGDVETTGWHFSGSAEILPLPYPLGAFGEAQDVWCIYDMMGIDLLIHYRPAAGIHYEGQTPFGGLDTSFTLIDYETGRPNLQAVYSSVWVYSPKASAAFNLTTGNVWQAVTDVRQTADDALLSANQAATMVNYHATLDATPHAGKFVTPGQLTNAILDNMTMHPTFEQVNGIIMSNAVSQMTIYTNASGAATSWWQVASGVTNSGTFTSGATNITDGVTSGTYSEATRTLDISDILAGVSMELPDGIVTNGMNSPVTLGKTYSYASDRVGIQTTADNGVDVLQVNGKSVLGSHVLVTTSSTGASTARKTYNSIPLALEVQFGGTTDNYSYPMAFFNNNTAGGNYVFTSFAINLGAATAGDVMVENPKGGMLSYCNGDQRCTVGTSWTGTPVWTAKKATQNMLVGTTTDNGTDKLQVNGAVKATSVKSVYKTSNGTSAVANGTYTVGIGTTQNGTITITDGIITAIQQAQ